MEGDAIIGEAADELGDEEASVVEAKAEERGVGGTEVAGTGGSVDGGDEEGLEGRER